MQQEREHHSRQRSVQEFHRPVVPTGDHVYSTMLHWLNYACEFREHWSAHMVVVDKQTAYATTNERHVRTSQKLGNN
jgi:hypothetical protein